MITQEDIDAMLDQASLNGTEALTRALKRRESWPNRPDMWFAGNAGVDAAMHGAQVITDLLANLLAEQHKAGLQSMSLGPKRTEG